MLLVTLILGSSALLAIVVAVWVLLRNRALEDEVLRDVLTGVGNRRGFEEFVGGLPDGTALAVVMIDFDRFKQINDRYGHASGDEALVRVAGALSESAAASYGDRARVFRLGGDEFVLSIEGADVLHASAVVERARGNVSMVLRRHERELTISCGIACSPVHCDDVTELLNYADRALYHAKRQGRDRTIIYSPTLFDVDAERDSRNILRILADALAAAVDAKDAYTHAHSRNVSDLSLYLARAMGLSESQVEDIALGALLHDIGKIGVSDETLRKPGKLSDDEWNEIKSHCEIGYTILDGIEGAEHIREMVLYHHERPDGSGYPRQLRGEDIPMAARIIGVADAFDSMTAERVYQKPRSPEEAITEILRLRGRQFDVDVVDALCHLMVYDLNEVEADDEEPGAYDVVRAA